MRIEVLVCWAHAVTVTSTIVDPFRTKGIWRVHSRVASDLSAPTHVGSKVLMVGCPSVLLQGSYRWKMSMGAASSVAITARSRGADSPKRKLPQHHRQQPPMTRAGTQIRVEEN